MRLYDRLFRIPNPEDEEHFTEFLNPDSLQIVHGYGEPDLARVPQGTHLQFERLGYFYPDPDSTEQLPVFNRTITLRDTWAKVMQKVKAGGT